MNETSINVESSNGIALQRRSQGNAFVPIRVECLVFSYHDSELNLMTAESSASDGAYSVLHTMAESDESWSDAAYRLLYQFTGIDDVNLEQIHTRKISVGEMSNQICITYLALTNIEQVDFKFQKLPNIKWAPLNSVSSMRANENEIFVKAKSFLKTKSVFEPLIFKLLPQKFTIRNLHNLYEALYDETIDVANFNKKIMAWDVLTKLNEKEKATSRKGAYYYSFDRVKYRNRAEGRSFRFL
jgi:ADP-ribose pyrophosphatase YjhB (NUDIX family)